MYVGPIKSSFPEDISVEDLEKHFLKYKAYILHVKLNTGSTTRCGFITFACREIAEAVKKEFRCTSIRGCLIQLTQCAITSHLNPVMVTERWKISQQLFRFINNHYNKQIEIFNKNGGAFVYQNGSNSCAIISCAERDLLTQFFGGIHKKYTQKSIQFEPSTWFRANDVVRTKHKCSILAKAESLFGDATNCDIIVQRDKHATLLVGTCEGVAATHMWLLDQLKEDLEVER